MRELQVLAGMSQGKSNGQIGRELYLSEDTVKTHARRLFRKLGVRDRPRPSPTASAEAWCPDLADQHNVMAPPQGPALSLRRVGAAGCSFLAGVACRRVP